MGISMAGGVYLGGAVAVNSFGKVVRDELLPEEVVNKVLAHSESCGLTAVLIHRDKSWAAAQDTWTDWLVASGDPRPIGVGKKALHRRSSKSNLVCLMGDTCAVEAAESSIKSLLEGSSAHLVRP